MVDPYYDKREARSWGRENVNSGSGSSALEGGGAAGGSGLAGKRG